jgi:hypothetical protein
VRGYFPYGSVWYSISQAHKYGTKIVGGSYQTLNAPRDTPLPAFLRGENLKWISHLLNLFPLLAGAIITKQKPGLTIEETRQNPFQLMVALGKNCTNKNNLFMAI